ncbi:MAG: hypothetical protein AAGA03_15095 [Planctomycetota bacterium]
MFPVDPSLFSNVTSAVQRTSSLPGGAVRGLPGGAVLDGLQGVGSFGSDVVEAHTEFKLGRIHSALQRVRQLESQFNGIAGRWHSMANSMVSSAKQGRQQVPLQKLNDIKAAQIKMQQLTGPASKAFRDLVSALEHAVAMSGRSSDPDDEENDQEQTSKADDRSPDTQTPSETPVSSSASALVAASNPDEPDLDLLGQFATNYRFGAKLQIKVGKDKRKRIEPKLEENKFYFVSGFSPPRVIRVREIQPKAVLIFDTHLSGEALLEAPRLMGLILKGIWRLESK